MPPSIQDLIEDSNILARRLLFDNQIKSLGLLTTATRIKFDVDQRYGDENNPKAIYNDNIEVVISYPGGVPLTRNRSDDTNTEVNGTAVFLYDVLPIKIYSKFEDKIEKGDYLLHRFKDEIGNYTTLVLQIVEILGSFRKNLLWKENNAAPANTIPPEVDQVIKTLDLTNK
jgi:hypothetical protein